MRGRDGKSVWDGHVNTIIFKVDNQDAPTTEHRKPVRCHVAARIKGELRGEQTRVCMWLSPVAVHMRVFPSLLTGYTAA